MTAKKLGNYTIRELDYFVSQVNKDREYATFYVNDGHVVLKVGHTTIRANDPFDMEFWKTKSQANKMTRDVRDLVVSMIGAVHEKDLIMFVSAKNNTSYYIQVTQSYPFYGKKESYIYPQKDDYVLNQFKSKGFKLDYMYTSDEIFNF